MSTPISASTASGGSRRRRPWRLGAYALLVILAVTGAWMLGRLAWWTTPIQDAEGALNAGDLVRAELLLGRVIMDDPRQGHARLLYARLLRHSGRLRDADIELARAMDLGVPEASLWREYGLLLAATDFRKADPILLRALQTNPGDVEILQALADGLSRQGRWPEAADFYTRWLRVEPDRSEALLGRSRALVQSGQSRVATVELQAILAHHPDDYEARMLLANCYLNNANTEEAEPELEQCRRLRPDRPEPLAGLAGCAIERDDLDGAQELLDRAVTLDPSSLIALISHANLALIRRQYDQARTDFERVVVLDPRNKQGHMHLAQLLARSGDSQRAGEHEQIYREIQNDQEEKFRAIRGIR